MTKITITKKQFEKIQEAREKFVKLQKKQDAITDGLRKDFGYMVESDEDDILWDAVANGFDGCIEIKKK
jgi:hypothetical protein